MIIGQVLAEARRIFEQHGIEEAALEGEVLLRHVLGFTRAGLFAGLDGEMGRGREAELRRLLERRVGSEPLAYITGHREFYGLDFLVNRDVMIPRPETELLVEEAIALARENRVSTIADIGTGSGAIAVSLAVNLTDTAIFAADRSEAALETARENARRHGVGGRIIFLRGHLAEPLPVPVDMLVANLPYVPTPDLPAGEPALALDGGADGMDALRDFCRQASSKLRKGGFVVMEVGLGQSQETARLLAGSFPTAQVEVHRDMAGIERVLTARLTGRRR